MSSREILRREFDAEEGSFLLQARVQLKWDWDAFRRLTSAMYDVAEEVKGNLPLRRGSRRVSGIAIHSSGIGRATPISRNRRKKPIKRLPNLCTTLHSSSSLAKAPIRMILCARRPMAKQGVRFGRTPWRNAFRSRNPTAVTRVH
jgi:hypothetical protein